MRVENTSDPRTIMPSDPAVAPVMNVPKSDSIDMVSHARGHGGQQDEQAQRHAGSALLEAMDLAEEHLQGTGMNIRLRTSENSERLQVEVFDPKTKEVLRRFPPDEIIRLAESIDEMAGLIVNRSL